MAKGAFAKGSLAWGICQRCGARFLNKTLRFDGYIKGLRVCNECYDGPQEQERAIDVSDPMALRHPSPEVSIEPGYGIPAPELETFMS